ncbi:hypothetical protein ACWEKM_31575 [Streptomyces sp. NPDC004752]
MAPSEFVHGVPLPCATEPGDHDHANGESGVQESTGLKSTPDPLELRAGSRHREPVDVRLILRRGGEVLLSRRAGDTYASGLQSIEAAAIRRPPTAIPTGILGIQELLGSAKAEARRMLRHARHHVTVCVTSVWLVMETQRPDRHTCAFERIQELPLGR